MKFYRQVMFTLRVEAGFFVRFPRLLMATLVVICIPSLYCAIYLASVWDPASKVSALPVALINLDQGYTYRGQKFNVGAEVVSRLHQRNTFGFADFADEAVAREMVRTGKLAFALIIPHDFSSNAIPGHAAGAGRLVVFTSEGNNFESALIAKNFASELGHDVNENLNERRWQLVLLSAAGSQRSVTTLRSSVAQLRQGAHELSKGSGQLTKGAQQSANGAQKLANGVKQLTGGVRQLGGGLRTMDAKRPRNSEIERLRAGSEQLATGEAEFGRGLSELQNGSQRIRTGVGQFREEAHDSILVPSHVTEGVDQLYEGTIKLDTGLQTARDAHTKLEDGAGKVHAGLTALATGMRTMSTGLRTMVKALPEDSVLDELDNGAESLSIGLNALDAGSRKLKSGNEHLDSGLLLLETALPANFESPEGSAEGLANSVQPAVEIEAAVANSGSAFSPNVIPAALWLGAGIAAFLIHLRVLPKHAQFFTRPAQLTGKFIVPLGIVWSQAALVYATAIYGLNIQVAQPVQWALTLALASITFLAIVFALVRALGDAGKALSMIFLAIQLSSSGGILPVELSGSFFSGISPWLPLTWVVRGMKATMFEAYGGEWLHPLLVVGLWGAMALTLACWIGHWRFVQPTQVRPAVDF